MAHHGYSDSSNPFDYDGGSGAGFHSGPGVGRRVTPNEIRTQQHQIIEEQDRGLDAISEALHRQQKMGRAIQEEVTEHNVIIDDIGDMTTRADNRIHRETHRINDTRRKESKSYTAVLWTVIIVLAIAIIVVAVVPFKGKP